MASASASGASVNGSSSNLSQPSAANAGPPLLAQGDWTKKLVQLAKTAELK